MRKVTLKGYIEETKMFLQQDIVDLLYTEKELGFLEPNQEKTLTEKTAKLETIEEIQKICTTRNRY